MKELALARNLLRENRSAACVSVGRKAAVAIALAIVLGAAAAPRNLADQAHYPVIAGRLVVRQHAFGADLFFYDGTSNFDGRRRSDR